MKQRNQAPIFSGESSYFEPPKEVKSLSKDKTDAKIGSQEPEARRIEIYKHLLHRFVKRNKDKDNELSEIQKTV